MLNTSKTTEMVMDFRRPRGDTAPLQINGDCVEKASPFFLGVHIADKRTWTTNTSAVVKNFSTETSFPPIDAEKSPGGQTDDFLPFYHTKCAGLRHHGKVRLLHSCRQESPAGGDQDSSENHLLPSALPGRHRQLPLSR